MHASQKSYCNRILETKTFVCWLGFSPSLGKDSDEVATERLTTVVDVTVMPHDNPEVS